ncbi:MAG TPA: hypothetical protein ENN08_01260 [Bacteroidales bacterium]|nr:hypothetical protein [Bacteroidales bacterium]
MNYSIIKTQNQDGILTITISRPEALNALNTKFFSEMDHLLDAVAQDDSVKMIVITGEGKAFVAGADIAEMVDKNSSEGTVFSLRGQGVFRKMEKLDKPIIAAINGFALGGGLELALACDIRLASAKAKFGQPEVNLGLIPGFAATQRLPRLIGTGNALWLLMSAEMINSDEALRIGLVQKVFEPEALMDSAMEMAKLIASKGPKAVKKMKKVVREGIEMNFDAGSRLEADEFGSLFGNEGEEGMRAFLEKRKPNFL